MALVYKNSNDYAYAETYLTLYFILEEIGKLLVFIFLNMRKINFIKQLTRTVAQTCEAF